ncbi:MAG TPA: hypothetical protein PLU30_04050 [Verrucomicrobiae bacterium]|nr:hypothetical protein [Verrucomicrobiae bacterium]
MKFALAIFAMLASLTCESAPPIRLFDFRGNAHGWKGNHDVADFVATPDGIAFRAAEHDPWIEGPPAPDMPVGTRVKLRVRLKCSKATGGQVFFGPQFKGGNEVGLPIRKAGEWLETEVILPPQEAHSRLRIDPPGDAECVIAWIDAQALRPLLDLALPAPKPVPAWPADAPSVAAGDIAISQHPTIWSAFRVTINGTILADAHPAERIGAMIGDRPEWIDATSAKPSCRGLADGSLECSLMLRDSGGATWRCMRRFRSLPDQGAIAVETEFSVDRDRNVSHLPWVTLFPGLGTFGTNKAQALVPGVEYLENEPSSSEAEIEGEQANRRITDDFRLCYPMMAIAHGGQYLALAWDRRDHPAPVFDSPDRIFNSGGHLLALWEPPVGPCRIEHDINVYDSFRLPANHVRRLKFTLFGGEGATIVPAIQHYVRSRALPPLPQLEGGFDAAVRLLAAGWARSRIREGGVVRHAAWGDHFRPQPAADAPAFMRWLAAQSPDSALRAELADAEKMTLDALPKNTVYAEGVSHVRPPVPPLLFGRLSEYLDHRLAAATQMIKGFDADGIHHYRPAPDKPDFARTLGKDHANGLSATPLENILETATLNTDPSLVREALGLLDKQTALYAGTVPRGAQPWEMPLHTPDILGSARLTRCYTLGFLLTGEPKYLEQARYWAWTGLAMVYLDPPVDGPVGNYATIGVIGATHWRAPNWIGQPVQWCGLVYRSALLDLADIDPDNAQLWRHVANGITLAGLQMTFPLTDPERQGLLPDFFLLRDQISDGPAINPGTVGAGLPEAFGKGRLYAAARLPGGAIAHAPGAISNPHKEAGAVRFHVDGWPQTPYAILICGIPQPPSSFDWTGDRTGLASHGDPPHRAFILTVRGTGEVILRF